MFSLRGKPNFVTSIANVGGQFEATTSDDEVSCALPSPLLLDGGERLSFLPRFLSGVELAWLAWLGLSAYIHRTSRPAVLGASVEERGGSALLRWQFRDGYLRFFIGCHRRTGQEEPYYDWQHGHGRG